MTGQDIVIGHSLGSDTDEITSVKVSCPKRCDLDVVLIDTPGFHDTRTDKDVAEAIEKWLNAT